MILHVTDFHFRKKWFEWLALRAADYDAVCFSGDMLDMFCGPARAITSSKPSSLTRLIAPNPQVSLHQQARWVREWIGNCPGRLFFCTGNHCVFQAAEGVTDTDSDGGWLLKARREGRVFVDGDESELDGFQFVCVPWARKPMANGSKPAVVICHAPPERTAVSSDLGHESGDFEVTEAAALLPAGSLILSGHIHSPKHWYARIASTWCLNPGVDFDAAVPNHIELNLGARTARFISERGGVVSIFLI